MVGGSRRREHAITNQAFAFAAGNKKDFGNDFDLIFPLSDSRCTGLLWLAFGERGKGAGGRFVHKPAN